MTAVSIRKASALALVVALMGLSACGDEDEPAAQESTPEATATETPAPETAAGEGEELALKATEDGGLAFDKKDLSAKAGNLTLALENPDGNQAPHNVALEGEGVDEAGEVVEAGGTSKVSADLKAGEYTFYCSVGDHRKAGMEGKLTVE